MTVKASTWVVVRLPIVVVPRPETWLVERSPTFTAFSEDVERASSCVVVSPCVWVDVKAEICEVAKLSKVEGWRPPIWVAVSTPSCTPLKPWTSPEARESTWAGASDPICEVVKAST